MEKFDELMYKAGLTADGCWDQLDDYDKEAIMRYGEFIVRECARLVAKTELTEDGHTWRSANFVVLEHFGVEE